MNPAATTASANAAAIAAAEADRQACEEEEVMTPYDREDLAEDWEFKFLRSATNAFKHPDKLRAVLAEEAKAGWVLLEKFDDGRLRLKRPASAKQNDRSLGFDAYRTQIGGSGATVAFLAVALVLGVVIAVIAAVAALKP